MYSTAHKTSVLPKAHSKDGVFCCLYRLQIFILLQREVKIKILYSDWLMVNSSVFFWFFSRSYAKHLSLMGCVNQSRTRRPKPLTPHCLSIAFGS